MTDTPRTDQSVYPMNDVDIVWPEFARQLERENNELVRLGNELCDWLEVLEETYLPHLCLHQRRILRQDISNWKAFQ